MGHVMGSLTVVSNGTGCKQTYTSIDIDVDMHPNLDEDEFVDFEGDVDLYSYLDQAFVAKQATGKHEQRGTKVNWLRRRPSRTASVSSSARRTRYGVILKRSAGRHVCLFVHVLACVVSCFLVSRVHASVRMCACMRLLGGACCGVA